MNKKQMKEANFSECEILEAENHALWDIVEQLPVDMCDMDAHFWCDHHEDEEDE